MKWATRESTIYRTWEEFIQYKNIIDDRFRERNVPPTSPYTGSQFSTNQTVELATCRLESVFEFLDFVQLPENNDIRYVNSEAIQSNIFREHPATVSFLYEPEKFLPNMNNSKTNSLPIAITGKFLTLTTLIM